ncbi:DUF6270 domain-containing protein [Promicromonospora kroppenstedtii]|uniref:DUF6270 domain-containing protein n=1 Tax=Promicromonospora kroppenstedtii TaxID=440482 RepID=A0ABW7XD12_9MICO
MSATRVFVYGSCVSRDTFNALPQDGYELVDYVARQSMISAARPPLAYPLDLSVISSRFQQRMVQGALSGSLYGTLDRHATDTDLVLVDLTDERAGVFEMPDGSYVTRSIELDGAGLTQQISDASTRYLRFGTDEHFEVFGWAAQTLRAELDRLQLTERTLVLAPNWAEHSVDGQYSGDSYGYAPADANYFQQRYVDLLENYLGLRTVRLADTRSDTGHQWGLAPFHFAGPVYTYFAQAIAQVVPPHAGPASIGAPQQATAYQGPSSAAALTASPTVELVRSASAEAPTVVLVKTTSQHASLAALLDDMVANVGGGNLNIVTVTVQGPALDVAGAESTAAQLAQITARTGKDRTYLTAGDGLVCALLVAAADKASELVVVYPEFPESVTVPGLKKVDVHAFAEAEHLMARHTAGQVDLTLKLLGTVTRTGSFLLMHDGDAVLRRAMERMHTTLTDARRHARI